jgi:hypothetical protein
MITISKGNENTPIIHAIVASFQGQEIPVA